MRLISVINSINSINSKRICNYWIVFICALYMYGIHTNNYVCGHAILRYFCISRDTLTNLCTTTRRRMCIFSLFHASADVWRDKFHFSATDWFALIFCNFLYLLYVHLNFQLNARIHMRKNHFNVEAQEKDSREKIFYS